MITVIDNFLEIEIFEKLQEIVFSNAFPWYWSKILRDYDFESSALCDNVDYNYQFFHILYANHKICSDFYEDFIPILESLKVRSLLRLKMNLNPMTNTIIKHGFHRDYPFDDSKTAILYLNTNNGYTEFEDSNEIVESIENRIVIFDAKMRHTGTTCTDTSRRIILNINYF